MVLVDYNWLDFIAECDDSSSGQIPHCYWPIIVGMFMIRDHYELALRLLYGRDAVWRMNVNSDDQLFIVPVVKGHCDPFYNMEQAAIVYYLVICHLAQTRSSGFLTRLRESCPNPCRRDKCNFIPNAIPGSCQSYGLYLTEYRCACIQGFTWDDDIQRCIPAPRCSTGCSMNNTEACIILSIEPYLECQCKPGFAGLDCSTLLDTCLESGHKLSPNSDLPIGSATTTTFIPRGNDACGLHLDPSNKCHHVGGQIAFHCECGNGFARDLSLGYDNCLAITNPCSDLICIFGQCSITKDFNTSRCECDDGYTGDRCEDAIISWSRWSQWSQCQGVCGQRGFRRRVRVCLTDHVEYCRGSFERIQHCQMHACIEYPNLEEEVWHDFLDFVKTTFFYTTLFFYVLIVILSVNTLLRREGIYYDPYLYERE